MTTKIFILAGGQGTRFWPVSRAKRPKQFLALGKTGDSLLSATVKRVSPLVNDGEVFVVTSEALEVQVREHAPAVGVITEPRAKNTAASIGLAAIHAAAVDPSTVILCLPADHAVANEEILRTALKDAIELAADQPVLVTIGITPSFPHTGYGYIQRGRGLGAGRYAVKRFFEKPNLERAQSYCESGDFYWNSGMFAWRADTLLAALMTCMPVLYEGLRRIQPTIGSAQYDSTVATVFESLESVSIDFGVLEHVKNCAVVEAKDFGWNDVGSWDAWAEQFPPDAHGNVVVGDFLGVDCSNCIVRAEGISGTSGGRVTALLGVQDLVVIDTGDALLVCRRNRVQEVKKIVDELRARGRTDLI